MTQTPEKKERAVKTPEQKKAELQAKLEAEQKRLEKARDKKRKLEQKLKELDQPKINRKQETRLKILYGAAILTMIKQEPELERKVTTFLNQVTKRESDRKLLGLDTIGKSLSVEKENDGPRVISDQQEPFSFDNIKKR